LCKDFSSLPKSTTKKTNSANKPRLPIRQAKAFCRTGHACSALLPCLSGTKNGAFWGFWHRYFTFHESQAPDNQSDESKQKNSIFSRKPYVGRKQAILHHPKQRKSMTTTVQESLTHGMALISHPNKIIVKTFGSIRKSANFVGGTLLTTA
jgi:hypothetical protein